MIDDKMITPLVKRMDEQLKRMDEHIAMLEQLIADSEERVSQTHAMIAEMSGSSRHMIEVLDRIVQMYSEQIDSLRTNVTELLEHNKVLMSAHIRDTELNRELHNQLQQNTDRLFQIIDRLTLAKPSVSNNIYEK